MWTMQAAMVFLVCLATAPTAGGFVHSRFGARGRNSARLYAEDEPVPADDYEEIFPDAEILDFLLEKHRPLGCTVEESLGDSELKPVFISKVVEGGFADMAGLKVGDVIVEATGFFQERSTALGIGAETVKSMVAATAIEDSLEFKVARGTMVMSQHETALVDLCASVGENDREVEECVMTFLTSTYDEDDVDDPRDPDEDNNSDELMNDVFVNIWGDELEEISPPEEKNPTQEQEEDVKPSYVKPLPWNSRSSPSGTFVRDPATGEMKNLDAP